jgi:DNA-binding XRE family transcriptional regulator
MLNVMSDSDYVRQFCARVKKAREELTDLTQDEMADEIGAGRSAYRHYEGGRMTKMPHYYIPAFLQKTGASERWLMTGEGPMADGNDEEYKRLRAAFDNIQDKATFWGMVEALQKKGN